MTQTQYLTREQAYRTLTGDYYVSASDASKALTGAADPAYGHYTLQLPDRLVLGGGLTIPQGALIIGTARGPGGVRFVISGAPAVPADPAEADAQAMDRLRQLLQNFIDASTPREERTAYFSVDGAAYYMVTPAQRVTLLAEAPERIRKLNEESPHGEYTDPRKWLRPVADDEWPGRTALEALVRDPAGMEETRDAAARLMEQATAAPEDGYYTRGEAILRLGRAGLSAGKTEYTLERARGAGLYGHVDLHAEKLEVWWQGGNVYVIRDKPGLPSKDEGLNEYELEQKLYELGYKTTEVKRALQQIRQQPGGHALARHRVVKTGSHPRRYKITEREPGRERGGVLSGTVLDAIQGEATRAHEKHGDNSMMGPRYASAERFSILAEEAAEVTEEAFAGAMDLLGRSARLHQMLGQIARTMNDDGAGVGEGKPEDLYKELIQVAAMAASWAEVVLGLIWLSDAVTKAGSDD